MHLWMELRVEREYIVVGSYQANTASIVYKTEFDNRKGISIQLFTDFVFCE